MANWKSHRKSAENWKKTFGQKPENVMFESQKTGKIGGKPWKAAENQKKAKQLWVKSKIMRQTCYKMAQKSYISDTFQLLT